MTPTNRDELVALMERAHDNGDARREIHSVIDAMIKAGLAVVVTTPTTDMQVAATEEWLCKTTMEDRSATIWSVMLAAGRIDGGAA